MVEIHYSYGGEIFSVVQNPTIFPYSYGGEIFSVV